MPKLRGSQPGGFPIQDNDTAIGTSSSPLDFIDTTGYTWTGLSIGGKRKWFLNLTLVSHFDTSDGTGDCTVGDVATTSRRVANPTAEGNPYNIGDWVAGSLHTCHHVNAQSYTTTNACSFTNNTSTTIEVNIYDADETTVLNTHTTAAITGNTNVTVDDITIAVTSFALDTETFYKGIITVSFNADTVLAEGGRYNVEIIHHNAGTDYTYTQNDLFSDTETLTASLTGVTIAEKTITGKQLSGVYYYTIGDIFQIDISDIDNLNSRSYPTTQVNVLGTEYGLPALNIAGASLTGWTNAHDDDNDTYQKLNWTINYANKYSLTTTGNVSARYVDWAAGVYQNSANASFALHTYTETESDANHWDLEGETWRLEDDYTTAWDSTQDVTSYDGNDGLQVGKAETLFYPDADYSPYSPSAGSQPDYSAAAGTRYARGELYHTNTAHPNGILQIGGGATEADLTADNVIFEVSLDGTDWYNLNELYTGGVLADGDGCRSDSATYNFDNATKQIKFTLGTGGTTGAATGGDSGWGVLLRVSMPDTSTVGITGYIEINDWE